MDNGFVKFPNGAFDGEYWIHPTREVGWIRTKTKTGKWSYSGEATLLGAKGKAKVAKVSIEGKDYLRHRLFALATDGCVDSLEKFRGGLKHPVMHGERREEDARPNDADVRFGTAKDNRNDPNNKKRKPNASGHPVLLTSDTVGKPLRFDSVMAAAAFLGADDGGLRGYLKRDKEKSGMNMPKCEREGVWDAVYDEIEIPDAVRLARARAKLYLSPSLPNELFRKLETGKFSTTELVRGNGGYVQVGVVGGKSENLHRLVVETFRPGDFAAKLAKNPGLTEADLDVDHIDGDESNNSINNLEVMTKKEHKRKHSFAVEWIDERGKFIERFDCAVDAVETVRGKDGQRLYAASVRRVCDGDSRHAGGLFFRWADENDVDAKRAEKKTNLA